MSIKVLITDPISEKGLDILKQNNIEVLYKVNNEIVDNENLLKDIDGWIIRSGTNINEKYLLKAEKLQIIGRAGVGVDNINIDAATSNGVVVMNVPDGNTVSAAEHTLAMILALSRNIHTGHSTLSDGIWDRHKLTGTELQGKFLGVVGLGKIGREVIDRALSFNMKILGFDPYVNQELFDSKEVEIVSLDDLTKRSDYVTIHVPKNKSTHNLFDLNRLRMMKETSRIVNVARGGIINEDDLAISLNERLIAGAAIDVFEKEPLDVKSNLLKADNILLTPHLGASTFEAKEGVSLSICNQLIDYFNENKLKNAINIPIVDSKLIKKMGPFYKLSEKLGLMVAQICDDPIKSVNVECYGEARDSKSISLLFIKGLLSHFTDNRINMVNADIVAKERGISFTHSFSNKDTPYSNLISCSVNTGDSLIDISGSIYFENHPRIVNIMGFDIDLNPDGNMLFIKNKDVPGVIGKIGTVLGDLKINIAGYLLGRIEHKDYAYAVIKLDDYIDKNALNKINTIEEIINVKQLKL
tara:strand:+ start:558 stop:2138 length:1581 start_codon:yes stop_codon:yes gene_type:complete